MSSNSCLIVTHICRHLCGYHSHDYLTATDLSLVLVFLFPKHDCPEEEHHDKSMRLCLTPNCSHCLMINVTF